MNLADFRVERTSKYDMYACGGDLIKYYPSERKVLVEWSSWCGDVEKTHVEVVENVTDFESWFFSNY